MRGEEVDRDIEAGRNFLLTAASLGDSDSEVWLGQLAAEGGADRRGRKQADVAFQHFQKAALAGNRAGRLKYAECLLEGVGCRRDAGTAAALYERMIGEGEDTEAMVRFGKMLMSGKGVDRNVSAGMELFRRAAEAGNAEAAGLVAEEPLPG
jgi:TPR repeat protein